MLEEKNRFKISTTISKSGGAKLSYRVLKSLHCWGRWLIYFGYKTVCKF